MTKIKIIALLLALLLSVAGCNCSGKKSGSSQSILAEVNGQTIDKDGFILSLHESRTGNTEALPDDPVTWLQLKLAFLDQMVEGMLIEQEAARRGLTIVDDEVNAMMDKMKADWPKGKFDSALADRQLSENLLRKAFRKDLLQNLLAQKAVLPNITVSEAEARSYYRRNPDEFSRPEQVRVRQILVKTESEAAELLTRILTGDSFAELARQYSMAPEAKDGGDLGFFGRNQMPKAIEDACFALDVRQVSDIIKSEYGYHIFLIIDRRPATVIPFNSAQPQIQAQLKNEKLDDAWAVFLKQLKDSADITMNEALLASIQKDEI